jgi:hypothetical protein
VIGDSELEKCDGYNAPAYDAKPTPCYFGDIQSKKVVAIVGDSNVGNWVPGLNIGLDSDGYKLAVFNYAGCPAPDATYSILPSAQSTGCDEWHSTVTKAIAALHPKAVVVSSGADFPSGLTDKQWISGFKKLFVLCTAGSPTAARILMGTSPIFITAPPNCLAAHKNPQSCALHIPGTYYATFIPRDLKIAKASGAILIPTYPWFCRSHTCYPVISNYLILSDTDHVTIAYSDALASVLTDEVVAAINLR